MRSLEGGGCPSASNGNSLATYPTASTVSDGRGGIVIFPSTLTVLRGYGAINQCLQAPFHYLLAIAFSRSSGT
jgi:hypothetical protein